MKRHYYTLMVVPSATSKVRTIKVGARAVRVALGCAAGLALLSAGLLVDWALMRGRAAELDRLRGEARAQRVQVNAFAQQLVELEKEMGRIRKFDAKLRAAFDLGRNFYSPDRMLGMGGVGEIELAEYPELLGGKMEQLSAQIEKDLTRMRDDGAMQEASLNELVEFLQEQHSLLAATPSIWPVRGWVTSGYERRMDPFTGRWEKHPGLDIATNEGTPIVAPADGVVTSVGQKLGFGKVLRLDHGYGYVTEYGHNSRIAVRAGQRVARGQVVAFVGNTGRSTGPHLHYEVSRNGIPVNPVDYILN